MADALIDNSTLHGAAGLFLKPEQGLRTREINVQSLDSFLEAYVLNDKLHVDKNFWKYFIDSLPEVNRDQFSGVVVPITIDLNPVIGLNDFFESDMVYFLLNMFNYSFRKMDFYHDFLAYTGTDFGNYANADGPYEGSTRHDLHHQIEKKLVECWDWDKYNTGNMDHIDTAILAYRTINYIAIAEHRGMNLITHEIRNYFLSEIGHAYNLKIPQQSAFPIYDAVSKQVRDLNQKDYVQAVLSDKNNNKFLWDTIVTPFIPALLYENSASIAEVFLRAEQMRLDYKPFRAKILELETAFANDQIQTADEIKAELNNFFAGLEQQLTAKKTEWSFSIGFPWSLSVGMAPKVTPPKYLKMFRHFLYRYSLPESYVRSCNRLFGQSRWNRELSKWEDKV